MSPFGGIDPDPLALQHDATLKAIRQYLAPFYKWRQAEIVAAAEPLMPGHQAFIRIINRRDQARPLKRLFVASTLISAQRALDITRAHWQAVRRYTLAVSRRGRGLSAWVLGCGLPDRPSLDRP
ncbi:hypothetical protein NKH98_24855 [Mesorhizobium sp. M0833]|uniref:hypothetical protein n=1 Tax=unclassified Mesorhizobium TaxID=325217 RepID=UPI00333741F9